LPAMNGGAQKAVSLAISLIGVYAVWMGIFEIAEKSKLSNKLATILKKPVKLLFKTRNEKAQKLICLNLSANALGLGGVATPLGIEACELLEKQGCLPDAHLLFIISATSVQLIPTSVLSLMITFNSVSPYAIILPAFLSTALSTAVGIALFKLTSKKQP